MAIALRILVVLAVISLVVFLLRPRPLFVIQIRDSNVEVKRGKVPQTFLEECRRIVATQEFSAAISLQ